MPKIKHDGKGKLTDHDGGPIKSGESVIAESLWNLRVKQMTSAEIEVEKSEDKKLEKKEHKFKSALNIKTDSRKKAEKPDTPETPEKPITKKEGKKK